MALQEFVNSKRYFSEVTCTYSWFTLLYLCYFIETVSIITNDGRNIIGRLKGYDQTINIILQESHERIFSEDKGVEINPLGLYLIRGDNIALIGELDEEEDQKRDLSTITAAPLKQLAHA